MKFWKVGLQLVFEDTYIFRSFLRLFQDLVLQKHTSLVDEVNHLTFRFPPILSFSLESNMYYVFKLFDLIFPYITELIPELTVLIDEFLNDIHLLVQLIEFGVCERFCIRKPLI